jgi:hypothetical protein
VKVTDCDKWEGIDPSCHQKGFLLKSKIWSWASEYAVGSCQRSVSRVLVPWDLRPYIVRFSFIASGRTTAQKISVAYRWTYANPHRKHFLQHRFCSRTILYQSQHNNLWEDYTIFTLCDMFRLCSHHQANYHGHTNITVWNCCIKVNIQYFKHILNYLI